MMEVNARIPVEGKRWTRIKSNSQFLSNPHIVPPLPEDYAVHHSQLTPTFPNPLPRHISRSLLAPSVQIPQRNPISANAGRFSLSLTGIRKSLRRHGYRASEYVRVVESELLSWLEAVYVTLEPENQSPLILLDLPGQRLSVNCPIMELHRSPAKLIWAISEDPITRYIVHACCRYHNVVSYSKDVNGSRLTFILRPTTSSRDYEAVALFDTPPPTDRDSDSAWSVVDDSDAASSCMDFDEDAVSNPIRRPPEPLPSLERGRSSVSRQEPPSLAIDIEGLMPANDTCSDGSPQINPSITESISPNFTSQSQTSSMKLRPDRSPSTAVTYGRPTLWDFVFQ